MNLREPCSPLPSHQPEQTTGQQRPFLSARDTSGCAIEEVALGLGWLRECPYHGEPFKSLNAPLCAPQSAGMHSDCSARTLQDAALLASTYAEICPFCERENALPID